MNQISYVYVNFEHFGYDIHSLLKAFYPEKNIKCYFTAAEKKKVQKRKKKNNEKKESLEENIGEESNPDEKTEDFASFVFAEEGADICLEGKKYRWENTEEKAGITSKAFKDAFGKFFYKMLAEHTEKTLPWGSMIGIRPTKVAYKMLEEKKTNEEILEYYKREHFVSGEKAKLGIDIAARERKILSRVEHEPNGKDLHGYTRGYSLYIGIPFCPTTCLYCSFTSFPIAAYRKVVENYIDCLIKEMDFVSVHYKDKILDSVYIGGGTPTTLEAEQLDGLILALKSRFSFETVREFTVEAGRADSITEEKLKTLKKHGVGRISINPQTMKQETLDMIGRKASVSQVLDAFQMARSVGFDNINMDIILGLPGENAEDVKNTMDRISELKPESLTVHSLAIKRASKLSSWVLENGIETLNNTDETMKIAADGALGMGMKPYYLYRQKNMSGNMENVGYALEGKYGLYNILIMEEVQPIVALGAGTVTKMVYPDGRIERCDNVKDVPLYIEKIDEMIARKRMLLV